VSRTDAGREFHVDGAAVLKARLQNDVLLRTLAYLICLISQSLCLSRAKCEAVYRTVVMYHNKAGVHVPTSDPKHVFGRYFRGNFEAEIFTSSVYSSIVSL